MTVRRTIRLSTTALHNEGMLDIAFEKLLFQLRLCDFNLDSLVNLFGVSTLVVGIILDGSRE